MLAINFIQYTIEQVAERLAEEVRPRNGVLVVVTDRGPAHPEKDDPWREGEYPTGQRNLQTKKVIHTSANINSAKSLTRLGLYLKKRVLSNLFISRQNLNRMEYLRNKRRHYGRNPLGDRVHKVDVQVLPVFGAVLVLMQRLDGILIEVGRDGPTGPALS